MLVAGYLSGRRSRVSVARTSAMREWFVTLTTSCTRVASSTRGAPGAGGYTVEAPETHYCRGRVEASQLIIDAFDRLSSFPFSRLATRSQEVRGADMRTE